MISEVIKGDIKFLKYIFCLTPNLFKTFQDANIMKTQIFHYMKYVLNAKVI